MSGMAAKIQRRVGGVWEDWGPRTSRRIGARRPAIGRLAAVMLLAYLLAEALYFGAATIALATLAPWLPEIREIDSAVAREVYARATPTLTVFFIALTTLGSGFGNIALTAAAGWTFARRRAVLRGAAFALLMLGASGLSEITKLLVQRARPEEFRLATATGYSFPSGHALLATCLYGGLVLLLWRSARRPGSRVALVAGAGILAFTMGISRIYLGVHYPTDVIGGWVGGLLWLVVFGQALRHFVHCR